jgi:hypothetical protein
MPYVTKKQRQRLDRNKSSFAMDAGELNYIITKTCLAYLKDKDVSYELLNEIIGVLECAKQEFYRRKVAPYEEHKRGNNGDVY